MELTLLDRAAAPSSSARSPRCGRYYALSWRTRRRPGRCPPRCATCASTSWPSGCPRTWPASAWSTGSPGTSPPRRPRCRRPCDELDRPADRDVEAASAWYVPTHPTVAMHLHLGLARFMDGDVVGADAGDPRRPRASPTRSLPVGAVERLRTRLAALVDVRRAARLRSGRRRARRLGRTGGSPRLRQLPIIA